MTDIGLGLFLFPAIMLLAGASFYAMDSFLHRFFPEPAKVTHSDDHKSALLDELGKATALANKL